MNRKNEDDADWTDFYVSNFKFQCFRLVPSYYGCLLWLNLVLFGVFQGFRVIMLPSLWLLLAAVATTYFGLDG